MFNKNLIVGILAVVLLGGGIIFYFFSGNKTTTESAPVARKSELTRELAKQIIDKKVQGIYLDVTITGISMESPAKALVSVEYTYPTHMPSGEVLDKKQAQRLSSVVTFLLYDDGWRMQ